MGNIIKKVFGDSGLETMFRSKKPMSPLHKFRDFSSNIQGGIHFPGRSKKSLKKYKVLLLNFQRFVVISRYNKIEYSNTGKK